MKLSRLLPGNIFGKFNEPHATPHIDHGDCIACLAHLSHARHGAGGQAFLRHLASLATEIPDPPRYPHTTRCLGVAALRYHSTPVDGTAPAADTVLLHSPRPEHTRQQVLAYFIARGCQLAEPSRLLCGNTVQAEVNIQMQNAGEVWVTRYGW